MFSSYTTASKLDILYLYWNLSKYVWINFIQINLQLNVHILYMTYAFQNLSLYFQKNFIYLEY